MTQKNFTLLLLVSLIIVLTSCSSNEDILISKNPEMTTFPAPVELQRDTTIIDLSGYLRHPKKIDSVFLNKGISCTFSADSMQLKLFLQDKNIPRLSTIKIYSDGYPYWILLKKSEKIWYKFIFDPGNTSYNHVELVGDMNNWTTGKNPLSYKDGKWQTDLFLFPGRYEYHLLLDGKQVPDPSDPDKTEGMYGGWNSYFKAGNLYSPGAPYLYTLKAEKEKVSIGIQNKNKWIFVFWQNHHLDSTFWKPDSNGISIRIPRKAKDFDRSFLHVLSYNNSGISNTLLIPVIDGKVLTDPADLTREDHEAMIIYNLMIDRFFNGNTQNDLPVKDSLVDKRLNFMGGDLPGILDKIEENYFTNLGVNTLWISPVASAPADAWPDFSQNFRKSTGYHGYWPVSLSAVEKRFGTADDLKSMVEEAHSKDLNVLLDMVSNRLHKSSVLYQQNPGWFTPPLLTNKKKNVRLWKEQPYTTWFDDFLPTLDLSNEEVTSMMSDSAIYWIKAFELDGFRHDAINHVSDAYWKMLTRKLQENIIIPDKHPVFQIGEDFGTR
ncbi:MAG: alpha-amylase family glycosyl hydrolase, partial [Syntrophothermus sp.]